MDGTLFQLPVLPFIRESDFAVRRPWRTMERCLLDYLLIYIAEGHLIVEIDGEQLDFHQGDFCLIQPNCVHTLCGTTNTITPFAHMDVFYNPCREQSFPTRPGQVDISAYAHLLQPRLNDMKGVSIPARVKPLHAVAFRETLLEMVAAWQERDLISQLQAQALATELILTLLKTYIDRALIMPPRPQSLDWITSYLSFHLAEPLYVADLARRAHLSPSRFSTIFRQQFGLAPHQYLMRLRIAQSKDMLQRTDLPLQRVADDCGFSDIHHFSKTFKRVIGLTPGQYRTGDIQGS